jgi:enoyl-CoA hydratase/carnithine racemase
MDAHLLNLVGVIDSILSDATFGNGARSPAYRRVTFDHSPLNIFGPETMPEPNAIVAALESDREVKVVAFDSAVKACS